MDHESSKSESDQFAMLSPQDDDDIILAEEDENLAQPPHRRSLQRAPAELNILSGAAAGASTSGGILSRPSSSPGGVKPDPAGIFEEDVAGGLDFGEARHRAQPPVCFNVDIFGGSSNITVDRPGPSRAVQLASTLHPSASLPCSLSQQQLLAQPAPTPTARVLPPARRQCQTVYRNPNLLATSFQALDDMRRSGALCDVTLVAGVATLEDRAEAEQVSADDDLVRLLAHRVVLAAASPYFSAMFTAQMQESNQPAVYLQAISADALSVLLEYMYTAEIAINESNVQSLLPAAAQLQLTEVRDACSEFLKSQLHPSNCLGIRQFADVHLCADLLAAANAYTEHHFGDLIQCDEFLSMSSEQLKELISSDRLTTSGEEKVFEAVMHWVRYAAECRAVLLPELMEHVRLPLLSQEYLLTKVDSEPLIKDSPACKDYLIEALKYHLLKTGQKVEFRSPRVKPRQPMKLPKLMLVIGGQAPKAIRNVDMYDLQTEQWTSAAELPQRRCRCGIAVVDGKVYAVGGFNGSLRVRTVDCYDPAKDVWTAAASMEARRSTLGVSVLNGRIYAVGGFDGSAGLFSTEAYDPRVGEWRLVANMSTRRSSVGVAVLDGELYAVGGYDGHSRQCLSTVEVYEPRMDTWTAAPEMTTRRSGAGVAVMDGVLYVVGGHDGPVVRKSAEYFDVEQGSWHRINDMHLCRRNAGVVCLNSSMYAVGGDDGNSNLVSVETYSTSTRQWAMLPHCMPTGRSYAGVAIIDKNAV